MPRPKLLESGLGPKHYAFIGNVLAGKSIKDSSLAAGFGHQRGYGLMKNPAIRNELQRQMETAGITDQYLAKKIRDGLNAKTVPRRDGGKRYDDQFTRKQWADLAIKVKGGYAPEKIESEVKVIQLVIDGNMINALKDSKALSKEELAELQHTPFIQGEEIIDAEIESTDSDTRNVGCPEEKEGSGSPREGGIAAQEVPCQEEGKSHGRKTKSRSGASTKTRGKKVSAKN